MDNFDRPLTPREIQGLSNADGIAAFFAQYLQHPEVNRKQAVEAIRYLAQPMLAVQIKALRKACREFQAGGDIHELLKMVMDLKASYGAEEAETNRKLSTTSITRPDLKLICFDFVSGG